MLINVNNDIEFIISITKDKKDYYTATTRNSELSKIQLERISNKISPYVSEIIKIINEEYEV